MKNFLLDSRYTNLPEERIHRKYVEQHGGLIVRIKDDVRKCVVFFGKRVPPKGEIEYGGTGFLATYKEDDLTCPYLITARHVAQHLEEDFFIRVNLSNGRGAEPIEVERASWAYHPDSTVDLAATAFVVGLSEFDQKYYTLQAGPQRQQIWAGDPISIIGLFRLHYGSRRNVPIVHTGNVALLPDPDEKIPIKDRNTGKIIETEAYLVEAQTLEGLSGSPVFVREIVSIEDLTGGARAGVFGDVTLLGLYVGAWDGEPGAILAQDRNLSRGDFRVPVGMGVVVPAKK